MTFALEILDSLSALDLPEWQEWTQGNPFVARNFLQLLEETGCAGPPTGWTPAHLALRKTGQVVGVAPAYLKTHSRGEFVFDRTWADAYHQHGLAYYPKLVLASPFTPVAGPRLLAPNMKERQYLAQALPEVMQALGASSVHVLFPEEADLQALLAANFMVREGVQFHWHNAGFKGFDDFLAAMSQEKRKKIRQDRKKVSHAGVRFRWLEGPALDAKDLEFFYRCYSTTYAQHWSSPYLSLEFFLRWHAQAPEQLLLILAEREGVPIACALNVKGPETLYGRYWGAMEFVPGLHFEACYAQAIAYCIAHGLHRFEGGAQGEHKMARGLLPQRTYSAHYLADARFAAAVDDFLQRESKAVDHYMDELEQSSPFKKSSD